MIRVLVSACLMGERVRYDGGHARSEDDILARWHAEGRLVPLCPEVAGGLAVPRRPAEIVEGTGADVLEGEASVRDDRGEDVSAAFIAGAVRTVETARRAGARIAVLTARSPSCGSTQIHDGTFSGTLVPGRGVTAAALAASGVHVFDQHHLAQAAALLARLEGGPA